MNRLVLNGNGFDLAHGPYMLLTKQKEHRIQVTDEPLQIETTEGVIDI